MGILHIQQSHCRTVRNQHNATVRVIFYCQAINNSSKFWSVQPVLTDGSYDSSITFPSFYDFLSFHHTATKSSFKSFKCSRLVIFCVS